MHQAICSQACLWTTFLLFLVSTCLINKSKVKLKFDLFINKQTLTSFLHSVILETLLWDACWTNSRALLMVLKSSQINCIIIFFTHYSPIVPVPPSTILFGIDNKSFFQRWKWGPLPNWILDLNLSVRFNHWRNWLDSSTTLTRSAFFHSCPFSFLFFSFWYHKETKVTYPYCAISLQDQNIFIELLVARDASEMLVI